MFGKVNRKYYADRLSHSISFPMGTSLRNILTALSEGMEKQDMEMLLERIDRLTQKLDRELENSVLEVSIRANRKMVEELR